MLPQLRARHRIELHPAGNGYPLGFIAKDKNWGKGLALVSSSTDDQGLEQWMVDWDQEVTFSSQQDVLNALHLAYTLLKVKSLERSNREIVYRAYTDSKHYECRTWVIRDPEFDDIFKPVLNPKFTSSAEYTKLLQEALFVFDSGKVIKARYDEYIDFVEDEDEE